MNAWSWHRKSFRGPSKELWRRRGRLKYPIRIRRHQANERMAHRSAKDSGRQCEGYADREPSDREDGNSPRCEKGTYNDEPDLHLLLQACGGNDSYCARGARGACCATSSGSRGTREQEALRMSPTVAGGFV